VRTRATERCGICQAPRVPHSEGGFNYFCLGPVSKAYRAIERHARHRLRQWLCAKHKLRGQATKQFSITALHQVLGLVELITRTSSFPWAKP
jgi:RNA-directed DNA polymerase